MKQESIKHAQSEREIMASDVEELKKPQAEISAIEKEIEGLYSNLKCLAVEFHKVQKSVERELVELESEYKRSLLAVNNDIEEVERAKDEAHKVFV